MDDAGSCEAAGTQSTGAGVDEPEQECPRGGGYSLVRVGRIAERGDSPGRMLCVGGVDRVRAFRWQRVD